MGAFWKNTPNRFGAFSAFWPGFRKQTAQTLERFGHLTDFFGLLGSCRVRKSGRRQPNSFWSPAISPRWFRQNRQKNHSHYGTNQGVSRHQYANFVAAVHDRKPRSTRTSDRDGAGPTPLWTSQNRDVWRLVTVLHGAETDVFRNQSRPPPSHRGFDTQKGGFSVS